MSWIFSFLLLGYVFVRLVLRVRGQLRWIALRETLPVPPEVVAPPTHLSDDLAELFVGSRELRITLIEARRTLTNVEVTDPDAALGRVRDARYRRALMESWTAINRWLRAVRELPEADAARLDDMHLGPRSIAQLRDALEPQWRVAAHARALDPFELDDVHAVAETFERLGQELAAVEQGLERLGDDPYRDRLRPRGAAPPGPQPAPQFALG